MASCWGVPPLTVIGMPSGDIAVARTKGPSQVITIALISQTILFVVYQYLWRQAR